MNGGFFTQIPQAQIFAVNPPAINGVGSFGGFQFELEDRTNLGLPTLMQTAYAIMGAASQDPRLMNVFTQFRINSPQVDIDIDRDKAKAIGISLNDIFDTLEVDLASLYVNNFTYLNRSWQVDVQADEPYRNRVASLQGLFVSSGSAANAAIPTGTNPFPTPPPGAATTSTNATGTVMTPLSALVHMNQTLGAPVITHYNLYRNIELNGQNAPGHGSGEAIEAMAADRAKGDARRHELRVVRTAARRDRGRQLEHDHLRARHSSSSSSCSRRNTKASSIR